MSRVSSIEEGPPFTRVCRVVEFVTQWWVNIDGGWTARFQDGGIVPSTKDSGGSLWMLSSSKNGSTSVKT